MLAKKWEKKADKSISAFFILVRVIARLWWIRRSGMSSSVKAFDTWSDPSTSIGISSEAGFWCMNRSCLVKLGYEDENSTISPAIISKINSVKKIKKNYLQIDPNMV